MTAIKRFQGSPLPGSDRAASLRCYAFKHSPVGALFGHISCNIFVSFSLSESWVEKGFCFLCVFECSSGQSLLYFIVFPMSKVHSQQGCPSGVVVMCSSSSVLSQGCGVTRPIGRSVS